jgi:hypothetical protein
LSSSVTCPARSRRPAARLGLVRVALLVALTGVLLGTPAPVALAADGPVELAADASDRDGLVPGLIALAAAALVVLVSRPVIPGRSTPGSASTGTVGAEADEHH